GLHETKGRIESLQNYEIELKEVEDYIREHKKQTSLPGIYVESKPVEEEAPSWDNLFKLLFGFDLEKYHEARKTQLSLNFD
ncbi:hypothetical protein HZA33_04990, partial [Candidatus Pacearchaeota archaeon]|nr:hypothetical protein [Candidatus Pacearchaeota archaeon]